MIGNLTDCLREWNILFRNVLKFLPDHSHLNDGNCGHNKQAKTEEGNQC